MVWQLQDFRVEEEHAVEEVELLAGIGITESRAAGKRRLMKPDVDLDTLKVDFDKKAKSEN